MAAAENPSGMKDDKFNTSIAALFGAHRLPPIYLDKPGTGVPE